MCGSVFSRECSCKCFRQKCTLLYLQTSLLQSSPVQAWQVWWGRGQTHLKAHPPLNTRCVLRTKIWAPPWARDNVSLCPPRPCRLPWSILPQLRTFCLQHCPKNSSHPENDKRAESFPPPTTPLETHLHRHPPPFLIAPDGSKAWIMQQIANGTRSTAWLRTSGHNGFIIPKNCPTSTNTSCL